MSQRARDKAKIQTEGLRVLLVDDHDLFRTGLRNLLEEQGVQIVGEAANGQDAIRCVRPRSLSDGAVWRALYSTRGEKEVTSRTTGALEALGLAGRGTRAWDC